MPYFRSRAYQPDVSAYVLSQKVSSEIAEAVDNSGTPGPAFGWTGTVTEEDPFRPKQITMRSLDLVSTDGTKRRRVPVGNPAGASLWTDTTLTVDLQDALGNTVTYHVTGRTGERRTFPSLGAF